MSDRPMKMRWAVEASNIQPIHRKTDIEVEAEVLHIQRAAEPLLAVVRACKTQDGDCWICGKPWDRHMTRLPYPGRPPCPVPAALAAMEVDDE